MRARPALLALTLAVLLSSAPAASAAPLRAKGTQSSRASSAASANVVLGPLTIKIPGGWSVAETTAGGLRIVPADAGGKDVSMTLTIGAKEPSAPKGAKMTDDWLMGSNLARSAEYGFVRDGRTLRTQRIAMAVDGVSYALTYEAPEVNFQRYLRDLDSFSWDIRFTDGRTLPDRPKSSSSRSSYAGWSEPAWKRHTIGDISFGYPSNWHVTDLVIGKEAGVASKPEYSPTYYVTVQKVVARDLDAKGLDAWVDQLMNVSADTRSIAHDWYIPSVIKRWDPADATMLGRPARLYRYTAQPRSVIESGEITAVSIGDRIISVHILGRPTTYDDAKDFRDKIRDSLTFVATSSASSRKLPPKAASSRAASSSARSRR